MKHHYIKLSISSIIAMMVFAISPATVAETDLDIYSLFSDDNLIYTHGRRHRHHHRYNYRRYNRHNYRKYNRHHYRRYNRYDRRYRRHRRYYYDDRYNTY